MKKSIALFAAVFFISLSAAFAQTDSTTVNDKNPTKDMVKITAKELPQSVQDALSSSSYTGWESGEVYRSENSDKFVIKTGDATMPKFYYFDANGKPIKK